MLLDETRMAGGDELLDGGGRQADAVFVGLSFPWDAYVHATS
jgi:hypothetical protein